MLRECLGQVRYAAAADRPGKRRLWVSRELKPTDSEAQRLSFGLGLVDSARLGIIQLLHPAAVAPSRMLIKLFGTTHSKGLMGALLVKFLTPQLQAILIDSAQSLQLQADIAMQAFVSPVILRIARAASLQINAKLFYLFPRFGRCKQRPSSGLRAPHQFLDSLQCARRLGFRVIFAGLPWVSPQISRVRRRGRLSGWEKPLFPQEYDKCRTIPRAATCSMADGLPSLMVYEQLESK